MHRYWSAATHRYAKRDIRQFFRADAAYAMPGLYERLEEAGYFYANLLPANAVFRRRLHVG